MNPRIIRRALSSKNIGSRPQTRRNILPTWIKDRIATQSRYRPVPFLRPANRHDSFYAKDRHNLTPGCEQRQTPADKASQSTFEPLSHSTLLTTVSDVMSKTSGEGILITAAFLIACSAFIYLYYKDNVKEEVIDDSILTTFSDDQNDRHVISSARLKGAGKTNMPGRSQGFKTTLADADADPDNKTYYYYKELFSRNQLETELVVGALCKKLFGEAAPDVYLVEWPYDIVNNKAKFGFMSESIGNRGNDDLETWSAKYIADNELERSRPQHLGTVIAFEMLFGKSDTKLANLVVRYDNRDCYAIDNESAFNQNAKILTQTSDALQQIGEYKPKPIMDNFADLNSIDGVETNDNPHQMFSGDKNVKAQIRPFLERAIQNDINEGNIDKFYQKVAQLSDDDINDCADQFGGFIRPATKTKFVTLIQERREVAREHVASLDNRPRI